MDGWKYLVAAAVCSSGALVFLRAVACAIAFSDGMLKSLEEKQRRVRGAGEQV